MFSSRLCLHRQPQERKSYLWLKTHISGSPFCPLQLTLLEVAFQRYDVRTRDKSGIGTEMASGAVGARGERDSRLDMRPSALCGHLNEAIVIPGLFSLLSSLACFSLWHTTTWAAWIVLLLWQHHHCSQPEADPWGWVTHLGAGAAYRSCVPEVGLCCINTALYL